MKGIKEKSDIIVGKVVATTRDCRCSDSFVRKDTVGFIANLRGPQADGFDFKYNGGRVDVCIEYCGEQPRFREAYKNERLKWNH